MEKNQHMAFSWETFHNTHRHEVIDTWVKNLQTKVGGGYAHRARQELVGTVSEAFDANIRFLISGRYDEMDHFIDKIARLRVDAGFSIYEVQGAFEQFRNIAVPILFETSTKEELLRIIPAINEILAYTLFRFSDHFQEMHRKDLVAYAKKLEEDVKTRTAELLESELNYKTLVEEINDGYVVIQGETIVFVNPAFCQMHGCTRQEVLGHSIQRFIAPESRSRFTEMLSIPPGASGTDTVFEYTRLTTQGELFPSEITVKSTYYNKIASSIGICRDITQRVKMEKRVREAERMAYIGHLTTSLSHEIRNPLSAIKLNLQILEKNASLTGNNQRRMEISVREVKRLEGILQELLDFAKPLALRVEPVDINQTLWQCTELLEMKFKEKGVRIGLCTDPLMPMAWVDREKVEQAFMNLLLNALDASPPKKEVMVTSLHFTAGKVREIQVSFQDQGNGISIAHLQEIFKPFFTTKGKGTGLGLTNVIRVAEAHGGKIEVENCYPCGALFRIHLPCRTGYHGENIDYR
jgi:PAS domain S-box-containing protein